MARSAMEGGWSKAAAARAFHTTPKTVAKCVARFRAESLAGLQDRSSRPRSTPSQAAPVLCARVEVLRRQRHTGEQIAGESRRLSGHRQPHPQTAGAQSAFRSRAGRADPSLRTRRPWRDHPHRHQKAWQVQSNRPPYHRRPHQGLPGEEPFAVDFVKHAEAMGALTRHVESLTDLGQALDWAKATDRTTVITVVSDACTWTPGDAWWDVGVPQNERSRQGGHCRYSLAGRRTRQRLTFYLGGSPRTDSHTGQMGASKSLRRLESQKLHPLSSVSAMPRLACLR
jgi:leucine-zipper of insertion element IS481